MTFLSWQKLENDSLLDLKKIDATLVKSIRMAGLLANDEQACSLES